MASSKVYSGVNSSFFFFVLLLLLLQQIKLFYLNSFFCSLLSFSHCCIRAWTQIWVQDQLGSSGPHCTKWADDQQGTSRGLCPTFPSPNPHYNRPSAHWPCVKSCLVGDRDKYRVPQLVSCNFIFLHRFFPFLRENIRLPSDCFIQRHIERETWAE